MYSISTSNDLAQMILKRQLRSNNSVLFLIKGVDNKKEAESIIKEYSQKCKYVYYNEKIEKPNFQEVEEITNKIEFLKTLDSSKIHTDIGRIFTNLSESDKEMVSNAVKVVFDECISFRLSESMIKNGYIRSLNTINKVFSKIVNDLNGDNRILYIGKPDKYDILAFTILGLCGTDVVICDFDVGVTSECMCQNRFVLIEGQETNVDLSFLSYIKEGITNIDNGIVVANEWVNFQDYKEIGNILKLLSVEKNRKNKGIWKSLNVVVEGVKEVNEYKAELSNFLRNLNAGCRKFVLINGNIPNPTYEEVQESGKYTNKDIISICNKFVAIKNQGLVAKVNEEVNNIMNTVEENRKESNLKTLKILLYRYLNMFCNVEIEDELPLVLVYNLTRKKDLEILNLLRVLPLDICILNPEYTIPYDITKYPKEFKILNIGNTENSIPTYPENAGVMQVSTVAYNAEQELNTVLYDDTSLFRLRQYKKINPIVLKTTYEEMGILWNEPSKFRPSFNAVGDLVTVPTMFIKVNGKNQTYLQDIKKLLGRNTLIYQNSSIPLMYTKIDNGQIFSQFVKQLVFKDTVDYKRMVKSPYYLYNMYSEETQQLIIEKIDMLIKMEWCNTEEKNLVYIILDTLFRLPNDIVQKIHNYDFTGEIPKIIMYNTGSDVYTLSDCIILMFLKLIGFDIVIFTPTGYRVVEQYINSQWFNEFTIGEYDFNMTNVDFSMVRDNNEEVKRQGFFSRWF